MVSNDHEQRDFWSILIRRDNGAQQGEDEQTTGSQNILIRRDQLPITQVYSRRLPSLSVAPLQSGQSTNPLETGGDQSAIDLPIAIRKGTRECLKYHKFLGNKECYSVYPLERFISYDKLSTKFKVFTVNLDSQSVPSSIEEALGHKEWRQAVNEEMSALMKKKTWELVSVPKNVHPVGCKWVFFLKYNSDETIK